jgi:hypothetical protein
MAESIKISEMQTDMKCQEYANKSKTEVSSQTLKLKVVPENTEVVNMESRLYEEIEKLSRKIENSREIELENIKLEFYFFKKLKI